MSLGMIAGQEILAGINRRAQDKRYMDNQTQLMDIQFGNQQALNRQGADLAYLNWQRTNFPAQIAMLKKAGLNPALIYGKGAGQGTAGAGSGGSAAGGNAANPQSMLMTAWTEQAKMKEEVNLLKAQKDKTQAEAEVIKNTGIDEALSRISVNDSQVTLNLSQEQLNDATKELQKSEKEVNDSIVKLNNKLTELHKQKIAESKSQASLNKSQQEINEKQKKFMDDTVYNPYDPMVEKTVQYLSKTMGMTQGEFLWLVGGGMAVKEILQLIPTSILEKILSKGGGGKIGF